MQALLFFLADFIEDANLAVIGGDLLNILFFWPTAGPENSPDPELEPGPAAPWEFRLDARQAALDCTAGRGSCRGPRIRPESAGPGGLYRAHPI